MYRCSRCRAVSLPRQPLKRHVIYRNVGGISYIVAERPVCDLCFKALSSPSEASASEPALTPPRELPKPPGPIKLGGKTVRAKPASPPSAN